MSEAYHGGAVDRLLSVDLLLLCWPAEKTEGSGRPPSGAEAFRDGTGVSEAVAQVVREAQAAAVAAAASGSS